MPMILDALKRFMPRPRTPLGKLALLLVLQPLWAIPFALFFGTVYGARGWNSYVQALQLSLVFAYSIGISIWAMETFLMPRLAARDWEPGRKSLMAQHVLLYMGSSVLGSFLGAVLIRTFVFPGFMGGPRGFLIFSMYTLLFVVLFSAVAYALAFYRDAIDRARAEQELHLARRIQRSFLLSQFPSMPGLEVHAANVSSKQVSGDFYDVVPNDDHGFLIAIADVSGKGVPAALLTSMLQASLRTQASTVPSVGAILGNINQLVYRSTDVQQFATFFLARVDERRMELSFSNAGHNFPVIYRAGGERVELQTGGTIVGILEAARFDEETVRLAPGDRVVLYTDGISEAVNPLGELFGEDRLHQAVAELPAGATARETVERILARVRAFTGDVEPADDMTLLVLRVLDGAPGAPAGSNA